MISRDFSSSEDLSRLRSQIDQSGSDTALETLIEVAYRVKIGAPISTIVKDDSDHLGHEIAGVILRYQAFIARGALMARHTSDAQMLAYIALCDQARLHLSHALELNPRSGLSAGVLASFSLEEDEQGKQDAEGLLTSTEDVPAACYSDVLQAWSWKWGGSQDAMWDCLRRLWQDGDPRSLAMIARADFEERLCLQLNGAATSYAPVLQSRSGPITLSEASDLALNAPADSGNPGLMRFVHGWMGRVFWERRNPRRAKAHLSRTKDHMDPTIWIYGSVLLNASQRFKLAKLKCGLF